jgi:hypothetical protein
LDFLSNLEISGSKQRIDVSSYTRNTSNAAVSDERKRIRNLLTILACDLIGLTFKLYLKESLGLEGICLTVYDDSGTPICSCKDLVKDERIQTVKLTLECFKSNPAYVVLTDGSKHHVSNKKIINYLDKLYNTDPSKESRTVRQLIGALEIGQVNEFQILSYLVELNTTREADIKMQFNASKGYVKVPDIDVHAELTYEEALLASKNKDTNERLTQIHNSIKLWEAISHLIKDRSNLTTEELNDEEEDANPSTSKARPTSAKESIQRLLKDNKEADQILRRSEKLCSDYIRANDKAFSDENYRINEVSLCQFLVVAHVMTVTHCFTTYDFIKDSRKTDQQSYSPNQWAAKLKYSYQVNMQNVLLSFARFVFKHEVQQYKDNDYKEIKLRDYIKKAVYHSAIIHYLINKNEVENPRSNITDLASLNIFNKLGEPDENLTYYLEQISKMTREKEFNYMNVIRLNCRLQNLLSDLGKNKTIFFHRSYGISLIKQNDSKRILLKSILDPNQVYTISTSYFRTKT